MYKHFNMQPGRKELVERAVPIIFADQIFDQINMDGTKELLTRHVSENRRKQDTERCNFCFSVEVLLIQRKYFINNNLQKKVN